MSLHCELGPQGEGTHGFVVTIWIGSTGGAKILLLRSLNSKKAQKEKKEF